MTHYTDMQSILPDGLGYKRIDHVGLVVESIESALHTFCGLLGFALVERVERPDHGVEVAFLDAGNATLEILTPIDPDSGTARFLRSRGEGVHHVCLEVADIQLTLDRLAEVGLRLIDETPRQGIHGLVAFIHPKSAHGLLIELLEYPNDADAE